MPHRPPLHDARHGGTSSRHRAPALGGVRPRVDTRSKLLTSADSLPRPITLVAGYFDVLRAAHAGEMQKVRDRTGSRPLVVVVLPCRRELLSQKARAEVVAAI